MTRTANTRCSRQQLAHELQPLRRQLPRQKIDTRYVAFRPGEAGDKPKPDWIQATLAKTIGIVAVAALAVNAEPVSGRRSPRPAGEPIRPPTPAADCFDFGQAVFDRHVLALA